MNLFTNENDININNLLSSALKFEYCSKCPIVNEIRSKGEFGLYPRWGAGTVNAPIHLILERPGNQYLLSETGYSLSKRAIETDKLRKEFSEIMFTAYNDGVRYLEGLLLFLFGSKARDFGFIDRIKIFMKLVYITEFIKCPGEVDSKVGTYCSSQYLAREFEIIKKLPKPPLLIVVATRRYNRNFPSNFPNEIHEGKKQYFNWKNFNFLHIYHPSGLKYLSKDQKELIHQNISNYNIKHPDTSTSLMLKTAYFLDCLNNIPKSDQIRNNVLKRLEKH